MFIIVFTFNNKKNIKRFSTQKKILTKNFPGITRIFFKKFKIRNDSRNFPNKNTFFSLFMWICRFIRMGFNVYVDIFPRRNVLLTHFKGYEYLREVCFPYFHIENIIIGNLED